MILVLENEVSPENRYLVDEITHYLPESRIHDFALGDKEPEIDDISGVIVGGSTAGVYEENQYEWMEKQKELIHKLVDKKIPTLGICFGHQIINSALGGEVEYTGKRRANLVEANLGDDPLFNDVETVVPVLHSDKVTSPGEDLEIIASSKYYEYFATRHREAPLWTVQYHPEFTPRVKHLGDGWEDNDHSFHESNAQRTITNFYRLTVKHTTNRGAAVSASD